VTREVLADPLVRAVLTRFPGAEVIAVRQADEPAALPPGEPAEPRGDDLSIPDDN
jgi:hypothetical protein